LRGKRGGAVVDCIRAHELFEACTDLAARGVQSALIAKCGGVGDLNSTGVVVERRTIVIDRFNRRVCLSLANKLLVRTTHILTRVRVGTACNLIFAGGLCYPLI